MQFDLLTKLGDTILLAFITSIRHPHNSNSYEEISRLFERTLRSVCNQIDPHFRIIVVCNKLPLVTFKSDHVEYVIVDFPPPSLMSGPQTGLEAVRRDKGTKYLVGLLAAEKFQPEYVMFFDADDLVHQDLARFCNERPGTNGWFISSGYGHIEGSLLYQKLSSFYKHCGTCNIINFKLLKANIPQHLHKYSKLDDIVRSVDAHFLSRILGAHHFTVNHFINKGTPLHALPFPGAIYTLGTGENHSGIDRFINTHFVSSHLMPHFVSRRLNDAFGMGLDFSIRRRIKTYFFEFPIYFFSFTTFLLAAILRSLKRRAYRHFSNLKSKLLSNL